MGGDENLLFWPYKVPAFEIQIHIQSKCHTGAYYEHIVIATTRMTHMTE